MWTSWDESKWFVLWKFTAIDEVETIGTSWYSNNRRRGRYHVCMQEYAINKYIRVAGVQRLRFAGKTAVHNPTDSKSP